MVVAVSRLPAYELPDDTPPLSALAEAMLVKLINERGASAGIARFVDPVTGHRHEICYRNPDATAEIVSIKVVMKLEDAP